MPATDATSDACVSLTVDELDVEQNVVKLPSTHREGAAPACDDDEFVAWLSARFVELYNDDPRKSASVTAHGAGSPAGATPAA